MKTKFYNCSMMLAFLAGVQSALAQITNLGIAPAGGQIVLFWSPAATNYVVQGTTNLASPNWVAAKDAVPVTAVTVSNTSPARFFRLAAVVPAGMELIPAGPFTMGDTVDGNPDNDAAPVTATVSAFYMDVNLVSWSLWTNVYAYATNLGYNFVHAGSAKATNQPLNQPVQTVDWYDCVKWSNARSQQAGLTPVYYTDAGLTQVYTNGETTNVFANWAASGYRLPTEAEWEKAARGGLIGQRFPWGMVISDYHANYQGRRNAGGPPAFGYDYAPSGVNVFGIVGGAFPPTTPVGYFPPNGYGLYDMAGNLNEWCWDWYGFTYAGGTDPHGPTSSPLGWRVARGGSWSDEAYAVHTAMREGANLPNTAVNTIGFRCVRGF